MSQLSVSAKLRQFDRARDAARHFGEARVAAVAADRLNRLAHYEGALTALLSARRVGAAEPIYWRVKVIGNIKDVFKVYLDVLKVETRAQKHLQKCVKLTESLMPRDFHGRDWFDSAKASLAAIRCRKRQRAKEEKRKKRELEAELEQLRALMTLPVKEVLLQLPVKFPPRHKTVSGLPKSDGDLAADADTKKFLQRLIFHYHPDHVNKQQFGVKYFMLCQEITKLVTNMYYHYNR